MVISGRRQFKDKLVYLQTQLVMIIVILLVVSCASGQSPSSQTSKQNQGSTAFDEEEQKGRLFGGIFSYINERFINKKKEIEVPSVNKLLWSASLQTLKHIPIIRADIYSGTILSDWITNTDFPQYRYKLNVFIKGDNFKLSSLKVRVFKEKLVGNTWLPQENTVSLTHKIENAILDKARNYYYIAKITESLPQDR